MRRLIMTTLGVVITLGCGTAHHASATLIYSKDFSSGAGPEWSNASTAISNGERFLGASAFGFGNGTDSLILSALPAHTDVTVEFDLYLIQSWDGNGPAGGGPDHWQLKADGANISFTNFANFTGSGNTQAYPNQLPPFGGGGAFAPRTGAFELGHLGFGTGDFGDTTYRFSFTFTHTASTIALAFTSFQNQDPGDEGWGLDNVRVSATAVPEPSTRVLWGAAAVLSLLGIKRRRAFGAEMHRPGIAGVDSEPPVQPER